MEEDLQDENSAIESEFILSLCWDCGKLAAAYYNLVTFELMASFNNFFVIIHFLILF